MIAELLVAAVALTAGGAMHAWPQVQPFHQTFRIPDARAPFIKFTLSGVDGKPLYLFVCRGSEQTEMPAINYAAALDCRLMEPSAGEIETNLLVEEEGLAAWYSRGRMFPYQLSGACGDYPEYGRVRHFSLRRMRLTLTFENVGFAELDQLERFDMRVDVVPDASATTAIAASSGYLDPHRQVPGRSCANIQKGVEWPRGRRTRR